MSYHSILVPWTFTKCIAAALAPKAVHGMTILHYIHDWLLCALSKEQAAADIALLLQHKQELGLILNPHKRQLVPSQTFVDSFLMRACLTEDQVQKVVVGFQ